MQKELEKTLQNKTNLNFMICFLNSHYSNNLKTCFLHILKLNKKVVQISQVIILSISKSLII